MTSGSTKTGRPPQTSNQTLELDWLRELFQERLISSKCDFEWAPHSPDLNPPDFYMWGDLKDSAYQNNPQTIGKLKAATAAKIRDIPREEGEQEIDNFAQQMQVCLEHQRGLLENILDLVGWLYWGLTPLLTVKVIMWWSVTHMCFLAFSHQYYLNFLSKATNYFSHMLLQI